MRADLDALAPPAIVAIVFIAIMVTVLRTQNPRSRAQARERERLAEQADARFREDDADS